MPQPSAALPAPYPFANALHASKMHRSLADPAWMLGASARHSMNLLREHLRILALQTSAMDRQAAKASIESAMIRILAMLRLSFDDDQAVLAGDEDGFAEHSIGVTIAHQLNDIATRCDDLIFCGQMLEPEDFAEWAERAEVQIAALIHCHFVEMEKAA
jgi:hypothetical protein